MRVEFQRGIFDAYGVLANPFIGMPSEARHREGRVNKLLMTTPNEELHAKFFNEEAALVVNMSDVDLDEHIHELETIAREAKARILAASEEKRTRKAKSGNKAWRVEPLGPDPNVTDSLNKVKQRSSRMSKLDKMRDKMAALGLSDADIDAMVSKMVTQARKEPEALRAEAKLKEDLAKPTLPTIQSDEERQARKDEKRRLEAEDKELEKQAQAPVHSNKDEKLILTIEPPADSSTGSDKEKAKTEAQSAFQSIFGNLK